MANYKKTIGFFTIGGIALFIAGIFFLGGQKLFSTRSEYVLYFDRSVSGLNIGAPVVFRGVPLGNVTRISLVFDPRSSSVTIPVHIHIDENSIVRQSGKEIPDVYQAEIIRHMIQNGLSARLQMQSLVTGQYRIELDYHKGSHQKFHSDKPNNEIPTVPSPIDELEQNISKIPVREIAVSLRTILTSMANALQDGEELKAGIASFHATFAEAERLIKSAQPLITRADSLIEKLDASAGSVSKDLPTILASLKESLDEFKLTAGKIKQMSTFAQGLLSQNSPAVQDLRRLLKEAGDAARSLHNLADLLNRNPEALLSGKRGSR